MNKKVLLMILDGWGEGRQDKSNVIYEQGAPFIDSLRKKYPMSHLQACGEYVGLPDGQMGNSEVGHMNLGAGRVVYQDLVKINMTCRNHSMMQNPEIKAVYDYVRNSGKKLHLMGLCSTGGVHSSLSHVYEFLSEAKNAGIDGRVFVHCFMDGRDTDPQRQGLHPGPRGGNGEDRRTHSQCLRTLLRNGPRQEMGPRKAGIRPAG